MPGSRGSRGSRGGLSRGSESGESPLKSYRKILEQEIELAEEELRRPALGLILSALIAGIGASFSTLAAALVLGLVGEPGIVAELLLANAYSVGFVLVILAHTDLFTEYTTITLLPVFAGEATVGTLLRVWGLIYLANQIGGAVMAGSFAWLAGGPSELSGAALVQLGERLVAAGSWHMLLSATLAGWLMGLLAWLIIAARDTVSQIAFVWMVSGLIGFAHLHHSIIGSVEVLAAIFSGADIGWGDYARFLLLATLGNTIGGVVFAATIHGSVAAERERT